MKRERRSIAAFLIAAAIVSALPGCSKNDTDSAEGTEATVSINVIGGDREPDLDGGQGSLDEDLPSDTSGRKEEETVILTDVSGNTVTGAGGSAITVPKVTTEATTHRTLSESELQDAMTATTTDANLVINSQNTERYGYHTLSAEEKKLYDEIVSGVEKLRYKICAEDAYSIETWTKVYGMVYNQEPRLFYMNSKAKVGKLFYITKNSEAINQMQKDIDAVADKLVAEGAGKSTFEKLRIFHDYLVLNSSFELSQEDMSYNSSIYNALGSGKSQGNIQCNGYAKAMQYLCDKAGIQSMVVTGENKTGSSHAWNIVDVDGKWYNIDVTWDDPTMDPPNYKNIKHSYFLVPDKWIHGLTHMHINEQKLSNGSYISYFDPPACTETAQNYFIKNGLVYNDFDSAETAIKAAIKKAAEDKSRTAQIMVGSKDIYDKLYAKGTEYQKYAREFSGIRGISNAACNEAMLIIEFDVLYN